MSTPRFVADHILDAVVLDVTLATKDVIDARGLTHIYVYPDSGGSVKWSVVADDTATVHGPNPVTGGTDVTQEILVAGNFYLIEAITADCHAHPIFLNVSGGGGSDLTVEDEGSPLTTAATKLDFAGAGVTATEPIADEILVTIPGGAIAVEDEGTELSAAATILDFVGPGVTVTEPATDEMQVSIPGIEGLLAGAIQDAKHARRESADLTLNSTTWADLDTGLDLTLDATLGDLVIVGLSGSWQGEAVFGYLDVGSLVGGSIINVWSEDGAENSSGEGVGAWMGNSSDINNAGGSLFRTLLSADLAAGQVVLRFRFRTSTATNKILNASANQPLAVWAVNIGQNYGVPPVIPTANLVVDLNADSITGETHATALSTWPNDGSLADFVAAGADRPNYRTDGPNGRAMVRFNDAGSDEFMEIASGVTAFTEGCIIVALKRTIDGARNATYYCHQTAVPANVDAFVVRRTSLNAVINAWHATSLWHVYFGRLVRIGEWAVIGFNLQADGLHGQWLWDSSGPSAQRWGTDGGFTTYNSFVGMRIGASPTAGQYLQGDIYRLLEYDAPLSQADFYRAMRRLAYEVGLPVETTPRLVADRVGKTDLLRRTAADLTLNSTTWANLPSLGTLILEAQVGDVVEVGLSGSFGTEAIDAFLDAGSDDSGIQNVWSLDGSEVAAGNGVQAWKGDSGADHGVGATSRRALVAADIVAGQVTIQFRYKTASASNRTLKADSNNPLEVWAKNHGPVEV